MGGAGGELPGSGALGGSKVIFWFTGCIALYFGSWRALRGPKKPSRAPCPVQPRRRGNSTVLVVLRPTVGHRIHVVGPITFAWGVERLRRFSAVSQAFLGRFFRFFGTHFPQL
jgi:hypothetical protein